MNFNIENIELFFIDNEENKLERSENISLDNDNLKEYIERTVTDIIEKDNDRKEYILDETKTNIKEFIELLKQDDYYNCNEYISDLKKHSQRLLTIEIETKELIKGLKNNLLKGSLLFINLQADNAKLLLICKIEHDEVLNEVNFEKIRGLNNKRIIYKSMLYYLNTDKIYVSDKNNSQYWHEKFLELKNVNTNKYNTYQALDFFFNIIDKYKNKDVYKYESIIIRNNILTYFRSKSNFNFSDFIDEVFSYNPENEFPMDELRKKFISNQKKFDTSFSIDKEETKKRRLNNKILLGKGMTLNIDGTISDIQNVIKPYSENGEHGIIIVSNEGFNWVRKKGE